MWLLPQDPLNTGHLHFWEGFTNELEALPAASCMAQHILGPVRAGSWREDPSGNLEATGEALLDLFF